MKVLLKNILLYSWLPHGTYHTNLVIWKKFTQNLVRITPIFSMKNPFAKVGVVAILIDKIWKKMHMTHMK
jgi:hypothetical protein